MKQFDLRLTEEEMNVMLELFDAAIKSRGLSVMNATNHLVAKLNQAVPVEENDTTVENTNNTPD